MKSLANLLCCICSLAQICNNQLIFVFRSVVIDWSMYCGPSDWLKTISHQIPHQIVADRCWRRLYVHAPLQLRVCVVHWGGLNGACAISVDQGGFSSHWSEQFVADVWETIKALWIFKENTDILMRLSHANRQTISQTEDANKDGLQYSSWLMAWIHKMESQKKQHSNNVYYNMIPVM